MSLYNDIEYAQTLMRKLLARSATVTHLSVMLLKGWPPPLLHPLPLPLPASLQLASSSFHLSLYSFFCKLNQIRESCQLKPPDWSHSTVIPGPSPLFLHFRMMPEWWDGARMTGMETRMTSWGALHIPSFLAQSNHSKAIPVIPMGWGLKSFQIIPSGNDPKMRNISF